MVGFITLGLSEFISFGYVLENKATVVTISLW